MRIEDIKIGMKVKIPVGKRTTTDLDSEDCYAVSSARALGQDFLYVYENIDDRVLVKTLLRDVEDGSTFYGKDLEPYEEETMNINDLKSKLHQTRSMIDEINQSLKGIKDEAKNIEAMIKIEENKGLKEKFTPLVIEMFKLEPKAKYAYIKNDGRIFFSEKKPNWDGDKWDQYNNDNVVKFTYENSYGGDRNVCMAVGIDTTSITPKERVHFFWTREEVLK